VIVVRLEQPQQRLRQSGRLAPMPPKRPRLASSSVSTTGAFVYCEDEPGRRAAGKLLTRNEGRRIAANIAKLPELLKRPLD
jgi:hypothetical protein